MHVPALRALLGGTSLDPVQTIVAALARAREFDEDALLRASATPLAFAGALLDARAVHGTLLFIDQLEELITLSPPAEAAVAAEMLGVIARGVPRLRLIATVRGDFLTRVAPLPGLGEELLRGLYFLYPLSPAGVRQAIVGPAQARGIRFESEAMIQQLVTAGIEGSPYIPAYGLVKAAQRGLAKSLAREWGPSGVRVNAVAPGWVASSGMDTYGGAMKALIPQLKKHVPLRRMGVEAEVSGAIVFLLSPAAAFITGVTLQIDEGHEVFDAKLSTIHPLFAKPA